MNQKKAKLLRRLCREQLGADPKQVEYEGGQAPQYGRFSFGDDGELVADPMGLEIRKVAKGEPVTVDPQCGRGAYLFAKKELLRIGLPR
ncbi:MAG: hypothetical protein GWO28_10490 [candidate division Zixibacteria bacterium]|nr:hypothetical protein [candidate division Zixibacteria bacterium]